MDAKKSDSLDRVQDKLSFIQQSFDSGAYETVVKECCGLFEIAFKRIFKEAVSSLNYADRLQILQIESEIGKGKKGAQEFTFGELVGLFRESDLMKKWAETNQRDIGLIDTINYGSIVKLRNSLTHGGATCSRFDAELVFNYLKNMFATLGFINFEKAITESFEKHPPNEIVAQHQKKEDSKNQANIALIKERGIIINRSDDSRNISYKVDTINRMLSFMYCKIKSLSDEATADRALYEMGNDGGKAFGQVMNQRWEILPDEISFEDKVQKWCDFDSEVGWGRFQSSLWVDLEKGMISGELSISENFLCYNRKRQDIKICNFIKGYCEGVLEELFDGLKLQLDCQTNICPLQNALKKICKFNVLMIG